MIAVRSALLAMILAAPGLAHALPEDSCFVLDRPSPGSAVQRLDLRVNPLTPYDRENDVPIRYATLVAVIGQGAQGLADGIAGKPLNQWLICNIDMGQCSAAERNARLRFRLDGADRLVLTTHDMPVADYGESDLASNLAEPPGHPVRFDMIRTDPAGCDLR